MTKTILCLLLLLNVSRAYSQQSHIDSLKHELGIAREDTVKVLLFSELSLSYVFSKPDSGFFYAGEGLQLARKINYTYGEALNMFRLSTYYRVTGYSSQGMQFANKALGLFKTLHNVEGIILCLNKLGWLAGDQNDYHRSFEYALQALRLSEKHSDFVIEWAYSTIAEYYEHTNKLDSALIYAEKADLASQDYNWNRIVLGRVHAGLNNDSLSLHYYRKAILKTTYSKDSSDAFIGMAKVFDKTGQTDSAIYYAKKALILARQNSFLFQVLSASEVLTRIYKANHLNDSTLKYMQITIESNDSLFSQGKVIQFQTLVFNEKLQQQELEANKLQNQNRIRIYILLLLIGFFLFLAIIFYRNNQQKQKAKVKIEKAYEELKSTQAQLVQREKMASLGELTAGIAHEIQNPLNFVNNFSEVNKELTVELEDELDKGNYADAKTIAKDIRDNEVKINHHGKRADAIIKGMLQHSSSSNGVKEPTNINALANEYLRLAYHGMRSKDKLFNATLITDYDETLGNINIIPQEIGRVLLNLINNAFYAVTEKRKQEPEGYEPLVTVTTKKNIDKVEVRVKDNGNGIPQNLLDKIFQPFFTTKPTGHGTGLGLSLSYDIVKAHGGNLKVETNVNEGTTFILFLPQ